MLLELLMYYALKSLLGAYSAYKLFIYHSLLYFSNIVRIYFRKYYDRYQELLQHYQTPFRHFCFIWPSPLLACVTFTQSLLWYGRLWFTLFDSIRYDNINYIYYTLGVLPQQWEHTFHIRGISVCPSYLEENMYNRLF